MAGGRTEADHGAKPGTDSWDATRNDARGHDRGGGGSVGKAGTAPAGADRAGDNRGKRADRGRHPGRERKGETAECYLAFLPERAAA